MAKSKGAQMTYTGDGLTFIQGVPPRNLTAAEWESLTEEQQKAATASGLYRPSGPVATPASGEERDA